MKNLNRYEDYANWLIYGGFCLLGISFFIFIFKTTGINIYSKIDSNIFDHFGSFVGGLLGAFFSLAGVYLLILNLKTQEIDIQKQQIENRFFELVKIHRENCNEVSIQEKSGREVFKWLQREFYKCYEIVKEVNNDLEEKIEESDLIDAAYISFFFGAVGIHSSKIVRHYLNHLDTPENKFVKKILKKFVSKKKLIAKKEKFPYKLFDGHQSRLGHYFRHFYHTVAYINQQPNRILDYETKYQYIKALRAQLTAQEQVLFFFNSLSSLGKSWEMGEKIEENEKLITKYNLIKNIPENYVSYVDLRKYYPDVRFERDKEDTKSKKEKIKNYR